MTTFLGQTQWDLQSALLYYKSESRSQRADTSRFEPREKPTYFNLIRMHDADREDVYQRNLTFKWELAHCPQKSTHHGYLDECSSVFSRKSVKRRWWCLLLDNALHFYRKLYAPDADFSWALARCSFKLHAQSGVLELKHADKSMLVSHADLQSHAPRARDKRRR